MIDTAARPPADSVCLSPKMPNNLHIMQRERTPRRFTKSNPCPICGGHDGLGRGQAVRCFGYLDRSGKYARCTREEHAGGLPQNRDATYSHRLHGPCRCGRVHGEAPDPAGAARPAANTLRRRAEQRFRSYFTLRASLRKRYGVGTSIRFWAYHDAAEQEVFRVLRVDYRAADGTAAKSYRPCHQAGDGKWRLARPDTPLPLYHLPSILAAPLDATIAVLEGEKCTDIATALGWPHATTSAHGAKAPQLTDWSPLAGRSVALLRDADADGAGYVAQVAALLAALDPPAARPGRVPARAGRRRGHRAVHRRPPLGRPPRRRGPRRAARADRSPPLDRPPSRRPDGPSGPTSAVPFRPRIGPPPWPCWDGTLNPPPCRSIAGFRCETPAAYGGEPPRPPGGVSFSPAD